MQRPISVLKVHRNITHMKFFSVGGMRYFPVGECIKVNNELCKN